MGLISSGRHWVSTQVLCAAHELFDEDQQAEATTLRKLVEEAERELKERYEEKPYQKLAAEEAVQATPTTTKSKSVFDDVDE